MRYSMMSAAPTEEAEELKILDSWERKQYPDKDGRWGRLNGRGVFAPINFKTCLPGTLALLLPFT